MKSKSLPPYTLRESRRAKQVRLKVSPLQGLEIVIPSGFDQRQLPEILNRHRHWIDKKLAEFPRRESSSQTLPERIALAAIAEEWSVITGHGEQPRLREIGLTRLLLEGATDLEDARPLLRRWLTLRAYHSLEPWLQSLAKETRFSFTDLSIRGQKKRWGSCSSERRISLNFKLLFLPPALVRHVLIHELCHTVHLDHSSRFWALVARFDPDCQQLRQELRDGWRYLPDWLET